MTVRNEKVEEGFSFSDNTCWILGAGASYDCLGGHEPCVPLTHNLIRTDLPRHEVHGHIEQLIKAKLISAKTLQEALTSQIEQTISEVRNLTAHPDSKYREKAQVCLGEIIQFLASMVSVGQIPAQYHNDQDEFQALNYFWLANMCLRNPMWSVITLNYDSILDWAFEHLVILTNENPQETARPEQYLSWKKSLMQLCTSEAAPEIHGTGSFIKLHGDLAIFSCHNTRCERYRQPYMPKSERLPAYFFGPGWKELCPSCGENLVELILPPGRNKTRGESAYLDFVYSSSRTVLAISDTWVILGYSCTDYDQDVTGLMKEALNQRSSKDIPDICVISPDALEVAHRLETSISRRVIPIIETFSSIVDALYWSQNTEDD